MSKIHAVGLAFILIIVLVGIYNIAYGGQIGTGTPNTPQHYGVDR